MRRRGQSLVEFAVCLPFMLMLMGAVAEFGMYLHRRSTLWNVARVGALELSRDPAEPDLARLREVRRKMLFAGQPVGLELRDIEVAPLPEVPGFLEIRLRVDHVGVTPFQWLGQEIGVQLRVPVEGEP